MKDFISAFYQDLLNSGWVIVLEAIYLLLILLVCLRIVYDTRSVSKTISYLLLTIFLPVFGAIFYFTFGINYRKRKIYDKKLKIDESLKINFEKFINQNTNRIFSLDDEVISNNKAIIRLMGNPKNGSNPIFANQEIALLRNGEEFFPALERELKKACKHIHFEYYIYENDKIGKRIRDILIEKAKEGVEVRFIYDDFGSAGIRKNIVKELRENGVKAFPFNKITFIRLANKLNYRNHRKIVVIDSETSFVGGINISDRYINPNGKLYWRDTHLMIKGYTSYSLQRTFIQDWNFCSDEKLEISPELFPQLTYENNVQNYAQIAASGPDSDLPSILYSVLEAVSSAKEEILITTPYYIPDEALQQVLMVAALKGVCVKLLVPKESDSHFVNLASRSYFQELLSAGVEIYLYTKGFVHSKTIVADRQLASVGTANLDVRSFDLNFEVSAFVFDEKIAKKLADDFYEDLNYSEKIEPKTWNERPLVQVIAERFIRLFSPFF